jgi:hypothetical protein
MQRRVQPEKWAWPIDPALHAARAIPTAEGGVQGHPKRILRFCFIVEKSFSTEK